MIATVRQRLQVKSSAMLVSLEGGLSNIMFGWLLVAALASMARIAFSPDNGALGVGTLMPYILLVLGPFASMVLALRWFADGDKLPQPVSRLARVGSWRFVEREAAQRHALYGAGGVMVSLLVGMLINVPVRAAEYLTAMPALTGSVPPWLSTLNMLMTLDVVLLSSLYTIAFVAALRRVPLFPRLLAAIWMVDIAMQMVIAELIAGTAGLPAPVAASLQGLLEGNSTKVLISIGLWLPYLLLSNRVNVTYRHRVAR